MRLLAPFVNIIASPHTSGPITGAALSSLHKFLLYGFITTASQHPGQAINLVAQGIASVRSYLSAALPSATACNQPAPALQTAAFLPLALATPLSPLAALSIATH